MQKIFLHHRTKSVFWRFAIFFAIFVLFDIFHESFTQAHYGYTVGTSDGFVNYVPYALILVFIFLRFRSFATLPPFRVPIAWTVTFGLLSLIFFRLPANVWYQDSVGMIFTQSLWLFFTYTCLFVAIFGRPFIQRYFHDLCLVVLILIPYRLSPLLIDYFWEESSYITTFGLSLFLKLSQLPHQVVYQDLSVTLKDFTIIVGPPCSGIQSLTAFTALFFAIIFLASQKRKIYFGKALAAFLFGFILVFLLNSFRILLILLVGVYYSQEVAVNLFHETIGAVLFLFFFIAYTSFILPKIIQIIPSKKK